jgi:hypothetical protein
MSRGQPTGGGLRHEDGAVGQQALTVKTTHVTKCCTVLLMVSPAVSSCEHGNESSGYITGGEFMDCQ